MGQYFNVKTVPLSGGGFRFPPKTWVEVPPASEGIDQIQHLVRKGFLVRKQEAAPVEAPKPAVPAKPTTRSVETPAGSLQSAAKPAETSTDSTESRKPKFRTR